MWDNFGQQLFDNIIANDRWELYLKGFGNTIILTVGAAIIGVVLGSLVAICKVYAAQLKKTSPGWQAGGRKLAPGGRPPQLKTLNGGFSAKRCAMNVLEFICDVYLTVIRGTPLVVQIMIFVFVIFASVSMDMTIYIGVLACGINSGAYVAEIVRSGIQAVGQGQEEAGRSLGLTYSMSMREIILPQAIKNILPALVNEAIVLLKETSIVGYVGLADVTYQASMIRSRTFSPVPLLTIALMYLLTVMLMTWGAKKLERRLARSER